MYTVKLNRSRPGMLLRYILLPLLVLPTAGFADGFVFTPYLGYRMGGNFSDISTDIELDLADNQSYGFIIGTNRDAGDDYEFIYSIQPTKLKAKGPVSSEVLGDIDVENFLIAGKRILNKESGTFVSGLIGATRFDPSSSGLDSETRFALGIGGGIDHPISKRLGFRLEARGIANFFNTDGAVFCGSNGGCLVYTESSILWQTEVLAGLSFKF